MGTGCMWPTEQACSGVRPVERVFLSPWVHTPPPPPHPSGEALWELAVSLPCSFGIQFYAAPSFDTEMQRLESQGKKITGKKE